MGTSARSSGAAIANAGRVGSVLGNRHIGVLGSNPVMPVGLMSAVERGQMVGDEFLHRRWLLAADNYGQGCVQLTVSKRQSR